MPDNPATTLAGQSNDTTRPRSCAGGANPVAGGFVRVPPGIDERHVLQWNGGWSVLADTSPSLIREFGGCMMLGSGQLVPMKHNLCAGGADSLIELKPCALGVTIWFHQTSAQTTITERELRDLYQVIGSHFAGGAVSEAEVEAAAKVREAELARLICEAWIRDERWPTMTIPYFWAEIAARAALDAAAKVREER